MDAAVAVLFTRVRERLILAIPGVNIRIEQLSSTEWYIQNRSHLINLLSIVHVGVLILVIDSTPLSPILSTVSRTTQAGARKLPPPALARKAGSSVKGNSLLSSLQHQARQGQSDSRGSQTRVQFFRSGSYSGVFPASIR